ncbi:hypothetical protein LCGC14_0641270 [marine sediment metagenome]|uniref:Homing endonuclease LAGLIDADG domain-containing protein n=1 Tax=marine sediment metagenome TaxID=412755 RepID=A0A0F9RIF6_9ZZZZ
MVKEITISYLAGITDGEGYIGIKKSKWGMKNRKDVHCPTYHERIQIRMIDEEAIKLFKQSFGGSYYKEKDYIYCYQISDLSASKALRILLPYLRIKKRQAQICLKLRRNKESCLAKKRGSPKGRKMSKKILDYRDKLWKQIKEIHQRK